MCLCAYLHVCGYLCTRDFVCVLFLPSHTCTHTHTNTLSCGDSSLDVHHFASSSVDPNSHSDVVCSDHRHDRLYPFGASKTGHNRLSPIQKHVESIAKHDGVHTHKNTHTRTNGHTQTRVQTISGDLMPTNLLENLFRYASMRAQFRNSRLDIIHQSLNGIGLRPSPTLHLHRHLPPSA